MATFTIGKGTAADLEALGAAVRAEMPKYAGGMKAQLVALMQVDNAIGEVERLTGSVQDLAETAARRLANVAQRAATCAWDVDSTFISTSDLDREIVRLAAARDALRVAIRMAHAVLDAA